MEDILISVCFETVYGFLYTESEYISTLDYVHGCVEIENSQWKESFRQKYIR